MTAEQILIRAQIIRELYNQLIKNGTGPYFIENNRILFKIYADYKEKIKVMTDDELDIYLRDTQQISLEEWKESLDFKHCNID